MPRLNPPAADLMDEPELLTESSVASDEHELIMERALAPPNVSVNQSTMKSLFKIRTSLDIPMSLSSLQSPSQAALLFRPGVTMELIDEVDMTEPLRWPARTSASNLLSCASILA